MIAYFRHRQILMTSLKQARVRRSRNLNVVFKGFTFRSIDLAATMNTPSFAASVGILPARHAPSKCQRRGPRMAARAENEPNLKISSAVERLYDAYPFPPETLLDEAPLGYNWRWHFPTVHAFCAGIGPKNKSPRILDAGCGTGESTTYLAHLNPDAKVMAIDLSNEALSVAKERLERSVPDAASRVEYIHKSIFDIGDIPGQFDYINSVGVIHHTPDPARALRALADKLAPGGLCHIFVYAKHGRWEISLMQRAIRLLRGSEHTKFEDGVRLGRSIFAALPDGNRLKARERDRWEQENKKDATFADMYLHPQEVDYDVEALFQLIDQSGLEFIGFSNPAAFELERIFKGNAELLEMARGLPIREQYQLVELLDPESVTHFEFFLTKKPFEVTDWEGEDDRLKGSKAELSTCVTGWPSNVLLDRDYAPVMLSEEESQFLRHIVENGNIGDAVEHSGLSMDSVRSLITRSILFVPSSD